MSDSTTDGSHEEPVHIHVFGASIPGSSAAGWGAVIRDPFHHVCISSHEKEATSAEAETKAVYRSLLELEGHYRVVVHAPSSHVRSLLRGDSAPDSLQERGIEGALERHPDVRVRDPTDGEGRSEHRGDQSDAERAAWQAALHGRVLEVGKPSPVYFQGESVGVVIPLEDRRTRLMVKPIAQWSPELRRFTEERGGRDLTFDEPAHRVVGRIVEMADPGFAAIRSEGEVLHTIHGDTYPHRQALKAWGLEFNPSSKVWQTRSRMAFYAALVDVGARMDTTHSALVPR
jgi:ribonuclease HI